MNRNIRILLINQEAACQSMLSTLLPHADIRPSETVDQALTIATEQQPDIIILNPDACSLAESLPQTRQQPMFILSCSPRQLDELPASALTIADQLLPTPPHPALLKQALKQAMEKHNSDLKIRRQTQELQQYKEGLQQSAEQQDQFCRQLTHDLNNSLTGIIMAAEMLLIRNPPPATVQAMQEVIDGCDEISSIIKKHRQPG